MNNQEKYKYAFALTSVASTGICFIEDSLARIMNDSTDCAFLRSFYILLSYNFELILKSRIVMLSSVAGKEALNDELRKLGHDLIKIKEALGSNLEELGIKEVIENDGRYEITNTAEEKIYIENFTRIRYDFLDDVTRKVDNQEHLRIKQYAEIMNSVLVQTKRKNETTKNQIS